VNHISEDVIREGILAQNDEEERSPPMRTLMLTTAMAAV